eukprot:g5723.t1
MIKKKKQESQKQIKINEQKLEQFVMELRNKELYLNQLESESSLSADCKTLLDKRKHTIQALEWKLQTIEKTSNSKQEKTKAMESEIEILNKVIMNEEEDASLKTLALQNHKQSFHSKTTRLQELRSALKNIEDKHDKLQHQLISERSILTDTLFKLQQYESALRSLSHNEDVFGRLTNIAKLKDARFAVPVNCALRQIVSLHAFVLVSTSSAAKNIVQYFQEQQIGLVTCSIVQETSSSLSRPSAGANSLAEFVEVVDQRFQPVLDRLLGNWVLVEDEIKAIEMIRRGQNLNFVTKTGEVFLSNGVVRSSGKVHSEFEKCFLKTEFQKMTNFTSPTPVTSMQSFGDRKLNAEELELVGKQLQTEMNEIRKENRELRKSISDHEAKIQELETELQSTWTVLESKKSLVSILNEKQSNLVQELQGLNVDSIRQELTGAKAEYKALRIRCEGSDLQLKLEEEIEALSLQIKELRTNRELFQKQWTELDQQLEAVQSEQIKYEAMVQKLNELSSQMDHYDNQKCKTEHELKEHKTKYIKLQKLAFDVHKRLECNKSELQELESKVFCEQKQKKQISVEVEQNMESLENDLIALEANFQDSSQFHELKQQLQYSIRCDRIEQLAFLEALDTLLKTNPELKAARSVHGESNFDMEWLMIKAEEQRLEKQRSTIDHDILQFDLDQFRQIHELQQQQIKEQESSKNTVIRVGELEKIRFDLLSDGLSKVNSKLNDIYKQLTNQQGTASLGYSRNSKLLFQNGIDFHCRPNTTCDPSGLFSVLSVGQQCLATLALSFAIQDVFPSPFYFFDEMDCALDEVNANQVICYIKEQQNAQYFLISHKSFVFEHADWLIGVFGTYQDISVVLFNCQDTEESSEK